MHSRRQQTTIATATARRAATALVSSTSQYRHYVPIFKEAPPSDRIAEGLVSGQATLLWGPTESRVPTIAHGAILLAECGIDAAGCQQLRPQETSGFALAAEDDAGTNLITPSSQESYRKSLRFWMSFFEEKYLQQTRLLRRSAAQHVGTLNGADVLTDEADRPETKWGEDTYFREASFVAANFLKKNVTNLEELDAAVLAAGPAEFLSFLQVFRHQTLTLAPVPASAAWAYEEDQRKQWAERWKPLQTTARKEFVPRLVRAAQQGGWPAVAEKIAAALGSIQAVLVAREARQVAAGIRQDWAAMSANERAAAGCALAERLFKGFLEGDVDPEDTADKSEEWLQENQKIQDLAAAPIEGAEFSYRDFWLHTERVEALEFEHLWASHHFRVLFGAAYAQARVDSGSAAAFYLDVAEALGKSTLDAKAGVVVPFMNPVWCKLHWVKFGASTTTQHTASARRQLLFQHHSLRGVKALATLFYKTLPLSSAIDYASPYKFRKSLVAACADYGVGTVASEHFYGVGGMTRVWGAEEATGIVAEAIKQNFGATRRARYASVRAREAASLPTASDKATILPLNAGAAPSEADKQWIMGSRRTVTYQYSSPHIALLRTNPKTGHEAILFARDTARKGAVEVSLMRKVSAEAKTTRHMVATQLFGEALGVIKRHSAPLVAARDRAVEFCEAVTGLKEVPLDGIVSEGFASANGAEWEFVTILDDNAALSADESVSVKLPFAVPTGRYRRMEPLPYGEYCLRLRFYDHASNPQHDPTRCQEAWTGAFVGVDAVPTIVEGLLKIPAADLTAAVAAAAPLTAHLDHHALSSSSSDREGAAEANGLSTAAAEALAAKVDAVLAVHGKNLIPLCTALREYGIEVPVQLEFAVGQVLNIKGEFFLDVLYRQLRHSEHGSGLPTNDDLTAPQLQYEARIRRHWESCVFVGASEEEWQTMRRHVLNHALDHELEWWFEEDWLTAKVSLTDGTLESRRLFAGHVCRLLGADSGNGGLDVRRMAGLPRDPLEARATVLGDGTVSDLQLSVLRDGGVSVNDCLAAAHGAINRAHLRLNTLAAQKLELFDKQCLIAAYHQGPTTTAIGGKFATTTLFALEKAHEEVQPSASPLMSVEGALRELKPVDRFASKDNQDLRRRIFTEETDYRHIPVHNDASANEHSDTWGV